jgi:hypothetical protein
MIRERKPWLSNWVELWKSVDLEKLPEAAEKQSELELGFTYDGTLIAGLSQREDRECPFIWV